MPNAKTPLELIAEMTHARLIRDYRDPRECEQNCKACKLSASFSAWNETVIQVTMDLCVEHYDYGTKLMHPTIAEVLSEAEKRFKEKP